MCFILDDSPSSDLPDQNGTNGLNAVKRGGLSYLLCYFHPKAPSSNIFRGILSKQGMAFGAPVADTNALVTEPRIFLRN